MTADRIKALEDALEHAIKVIDAAYDASDDNVVYSIKQRAALAASRAASDCHQPDLVTAARVRIKPLVWEDFHERGAKAQAWNEANYMIQRWSDGRWEISASYPGYSGTLHGVDRFYPTIEAAKAAAQADYEARILAALDAQTITAQDAARVERVAVAMWKAEADRAAPNVGRNRTPEMFSGEADDTRAKWIGLASAALRAIAGDDA